MKAIEEKGLSQITAELGGYRKEFEKEYYGLFDQTVKDIREKIKDKNVENRIFRNVAVVVAAARFFMGRYNLGFDYEKIIQVAINNIIEQSEFILHSSEVKTFWNILEYAVESKLIQEGYDFKFGIMQVNDLKEKKRDVTGDTRVISLKFSRIYEIYAETCKRTGQHYLPKSSLLFYLQNSNAYLGWKRSERFTNSNTSAYIFSYDDLDKEMNVSLERTETPEPFYHG